jgi:hypothetical protein
MWEPRDLTTLLASMSCYKDNSAFTFSSVRVGPLCSESCRVNHFTIHETCHKPLLLFSVMASSRYLCCRGTSGCNATRQKCCIPNSWVLVEPSVGRTWTKRLPFAANRCSNGNSAWTGGTRSHLDQHIGRNVVPSQAGKNLFV